MNVAGHCPECGGVLKAGSGEGLCARCLLTAALGYPAATAPEDLPAPGQQIGAYRIVRLLGEGGMGMVYLAEQEQPIARQVALKIIKLGMDTHAVLARFQSEQQALALMDHPNIAQVYEAGSSAEGRPYFAMEYVPGVPITDYCDRHRLDTGTRLKLFMQVANAAQHAHQKGVIHRDLKPSNILVMERDGEAVPKIIDFGLAKATEKHLTQETLFTEAGVLIGTPEYMSPEQAGAARDIDTRTDIYSLGVLLYELLVGMVPFDSKALRGAGYDEVRRIIREDDPPKPTTRLEALGPKAAEVASCRATDASRLKREVRGDLEWITMKTLEKDRSRRYASASDLAEDIRRHVVGEPVTAAPPGTIYRMRKFAARHTLQLAAASLVLLALLAALALSTIYYVRAEFQSERAERQNYIANLAAADQLLRLNQSGPARERLIACAPRLRKWEWRHLWHRSDSSVVTLRPQERFLHFPYPSAIGFSGHEMCWNTETTVECWDMSSYAGPRVTNLPEILANTARPWYAIFSPDHTRIAIQGDGSSVRILETYSGKTLADLKGAGHPRAFSPDGKLVALDNLQVWTVTPARRVVSLESGGQVASAAFSRDGKRLVVGTYSGVVQVWDLDRKSEPTTLAGGGLPVLAVAFSPEGGRVAATGYDQSVRVWSGSDLVATLPAFSCPNANSIGFSPDGKQLVAGSQCGELKVWDARTFGGTVLSRPGETLTAVAVAPDGVSALGFQAGGVEIVNADGTTVHRWQAHAGEIRALRFSHDGKRVVTASGDHSARVWDSASTRLIAELRGHQAAVTSVAFGPGSRRIVTGSEDGTARLWQADTGNMTLTIRTNRPVNSVAFAPDRSAVLTAAGDTVQLWSPATGTLARTFRSAGVAAFSPVDARVLLTTAPGKGEVWLWNARTGQAQGVLRTGADLISAAFSPDGRRIAGATRDGAVQIWDVNYNELLLTIRGEPGIRSVLFSPDGKRLLGLYEKQVRMWDTQTAYLVPDFHTGGYGDAPFPITREMIVGGVLVLLMALGLCIALFRRQQWRSAMNKFLARSPLAIVPWRAALAGRWVARVLGSLLAVLFLAIAIGEGPPWNGDARMKFSFMALSLMIVGLILAWVWEAVGGLCALAGYAIVVAIAPMGAGNPYLLTVAAVSVLHVLCWLRIRSGRARAGAP